MSPDCRYICLHSGDGGQSIKIFDLIGGQELYSISLPAEYIRNYSAEHIRLGPHVLTPDGYHIVYAICHSFEGVFDVIIREVASGKEVRRLQGHQGFIAGIVVTPDERYVITLSYDQTIRVWEFSSGALLQVHSIQFQIPIWLEVDSGGRYLYIAADDSLSVWSISPLKRVTTFSGNGKLDSATTVPSYFAFFVGDSGGWLHFLSLENAIATPCILTAWEFENNYAVGCTACRTWSEVPPSALGNALDCPHCRFPLRLNDFTIKADWRPIAEAWRGKG